MPGTPNWDEYCQLKITLIPQTPLILFQNQPGATLRATEVKPKLDKYLYLFIDRMSLEEKEELKNDRFFQGDEKNPWETKEALNYKMAIQISPQYRNKRPDEFPGMDPKRDGQARKYPCFYGADGSKDENFRPHYCYAVDNVGQANYPEVEVTITCFSAKGRELILNRLGDFFLTTNFGLRQNKGFGGFMPKNHIKTPDPKFYAQKFMERLDGDVCLYVNLNRFSVEEKFLWIDYFSRLLRSGFNYPSRNGKSAFYIRSWLFRYMNYNGVSNEKAWMKKMNISPIFSGANPEHVHSITKTKVPKFLRAPLGFSSSISYADSDNKRKQIKIKPADGDPNSRLPSHLYFKIIGDLVFICAVKIGDELWNKQYEFSGSHLDQEQRRIVQNSGILSAPSKEEFDLGVILTEYYCYLADKKQYPGRIYKEVNGKYVSLETDKGDSNYDRYSGAQLNKRVFDRLTSVQIVTRFQRPNGANQ